MWGLFWEQSCTGRGEGPGKEGWGQDVGTPGLCGAAASSCDIFGMMVGLGWGTSKPFSF